MNVALFLAIGITAIDSSEYLDLFLLLRVHIDNKINGLTPIRI